VLFSSFEFILYVHVIFNKKERKNMNKIALFGLVAASGSFAAGTLWNMTVDAYQVQVPETVICDKNGEDYGAACYESTGGWWFAYVGDDADGQVMTFSPITTNPEDGTYKLITTDESDGSIIPNGNLIEGVGLRVTMSAAGGASSTPAIAGIGFNWTKAETPIDLSDKAGYCIAYSWPGSQALQLELGWKEDVDAGGYGYDTWYTALPASTAPTALDLPWSKFKQDGWDKAKQPITVAQTEAVSVKIRLKNAAAAEIKGTLTIYDFGYSGDGCTADGVGIGDVVKASAAKLLVAGRQLSLNGVKGAASVEVINLQGQVVLKNTMNTSASMDLINLDAGVYMVRVAGKSANLTQKILLK
jgi:hypothetical protein